MGDTSLGLDLPEGPLNAAYKALNIIFVVTRRHGAALKAMERLFRASPHTSSHQGFVLLGESGAGKTSTLAEFEAWLRKQLGLGADAPSPLPRIELTGAMRPKELMAAVLKACGDPVSSSGTLSQLMERFTLVAPHVTSIYGLAFDEVHHAFVGKSGDDKLQMAFALKSIVSAFPKPIIALGPLALESYLDAGDGTKMRFERREFLEDMRLDLADDLHDLRAVLKAMDKVLPSEPGWSLDSPDMLKRLYLAGEASFGRIVSLVRRACHQALESGAVRVGPEHYSAAWREVAPRGKRSDKHDPFKLDLATVTALAAQLCTKLREAP